MVRRLLINKLTLSLFLLLLTLPVYAYSPTDQLIGDVRSVRTKKKLILDIPAGTMEEPWLLNIDYDESNRPVTQWFYHMGQESRRHEFRYEMDSEGHERTTWVTFILNPDLRPPAERLAGYEHWYTLSQEESAEMTRFETVQEHPVKSVYRYYDDQGRLVREQDSLSDLDIDLSYDLEGRLIRKWGYLGNRIFWEDRYIFGANGHLLYFIQSDLNKQLYQQGVYTYKGDQITFEKYILTHPVDLERDQWEPLGEPLFRSIKSYNDKNLLIGLENYHWDGPLGIILTEKKIYEYNESDQLVKVEEVYRGKSWEMSYDEKGNWIVLEYTYTPPRGGDVQRSLWFREIEYGDSVKTTLEIPVN